jgi:hypothetical protein
MSKYKLAHAASFNDIGCKVFFPNKETNFHWKHCFDICLYTNELKSGI